MATASSELPSRHGHGHVCEVNHGEPPKNSHGPWFQQKILGFLVSVATYKKETWGLAGKWALLWPPHSFYHVC